MARPLKLLVYFTMFVTCWLPGTPYNFWHPVSWRRGLTAELWSARKISPKSMDCSSMPSPLLKYSQTRKRSSWSKPYCHSCYYFTLSLYGLIIDKTTLKTFLSSYEISNYPLRVGNSAWMRYKSLIIILRSFRTLGIIKRSLDDLQSYTLRILSVSYACPVIVITRKKIHYFVFMFVC